MIIFGFRMIRRWLVCREKKAQGLTDLEMRGLDVTESDLHGVGRAIIYMVLLFCLQSAVYPFKPVSQSLDALQNAGFDVRLRDHSKPKYSPGGRKRFLRDMASLCTRCRSSDL